jgi:hypothetical protein
MRIYLFMALFLFLPSVAFAAGYIQLEPLPYLSGTNIKFPELMRAFFQLCMIGGAVLAVLMITLGGVQYMTSDVLGMKEAGRSRMKNAAYGLLLLLSIWVILYTINPALLNFSLNIGETGSTPLSLPTNLGGSNSSNAAGQVGQALTQALQAQGSTRITSFPDAENPAIREDRVLEYSGTGQIAAMRGQFGSICTAAGGVLKEIPTGNSRGTQTQMSLQCWTQ